MKIYTEEPEGQIKITDTGADKNLDIKGILRKLGFMWWIQFCDFANINNSRTESFSYGVHICLFV